VLAEGFIIFNCVEILAWIRHWTITVVSVGFEENSAKRVARTVKLN
jgi:hypothetical protein